MSLTLYVHPASITSRPVRLFVAEKQLPVTECLVDIITGEHYKDEYTAINPNRQVPALQDGAFVLTESSAILKYLAARFETPEYPRVLEARAKVDEAMDWFQTQLYRDFCYQLIYPQVLPHHKRPTAAHQDATIATARDKSRFWFDVLDRHILGGNDFVANNTVSIADYLGASIVAAGEMIRCDLQPWPNVRRWITRMKSLGSWPRISDAICSYAAQLNGKKFVAL